MCLFWLFTLYIEVGDSLDFALDELYGAGEATTELMAVEWGPAGDGVVVGGIEVEDFFKDSRPVEGLVRWAVSYVHTTLQTGI